MQPTTVEVIQHDIQALDRQVGELITSIQKLARVDDLEELRVKVFPRPGWTTPAEFLLVSAVFGSLRAQVDAAGALKAKVVEASRSIGR
jgi:hypothetical protein